MTVSEHHFAEYCRLRRLGLVAIPEQPNVKKTADFRVTAGGTEIVVEVKELMPRSGSADERETYEGDGRGVRARGHIWQAARQLRTHRSEKKPLVIVLFDNIRSGGLHEIQGHGLLDDSSIAAAMHGLGPGCDVLPEGKGYRRDFTGALLTATERTYVSAVCVLEAAGELNLRTYHNCHASVPLPMDVFCGAGDRHYVRQAGDDAGSLWKEIGRS